MASCQVIFLHGISSYIVLFEGSASMGTHPIPSCCRFRTFSAPTPKPGVTLEVTGKPFHAQKSRGDLVKMLTPTFTF